MRGLRDSNPTLRTKDSTHVKNDRTPGSFPAPKRFQPPTPRRPKDSTHIDHGVGGYPEERRPLIDGLGLGGEVLRGGVQDLQLAQGLLQRRAVLHDEVVARPQVLQFGREDLEGVGHVIGARITHVLFVLVLCGVRTDNSED